MASNKSIFDSAREVDIMVDLETLGTRVGFKILTIGAVLFDRHSFAIIDELHIKLDPALSPGLSDPSTIRFWRKQHPELMAAVFSGKVEPLVALRRLSAFCKGMSGQRPRVWCKGLHFDIAMIDWLYGIHQQGSPWLFYTPRDLRTAFDLYGFKEREHKRTAGPLHDALADCHHQVNMLHLATTQFMDKMQRMANDAA